MEKQWVKLTTSVENQENITYTYHIIIYLNIIKYIIYTTYLPKKMYTCILLHLFNKLFYQLI